VFYFISKLEPLKKHSLLTKKLESNCWCIAVKVKEKLYKGMIIVIYHSLSASHRDFMRFLEDIAANNKGRMHGNRRF